MTTSTDNDQDAQQDDREAVTSEQRYLRWLSTRELDQLFILVTPVNQSRPLTLESVRRDIHDFLRRSRWAAGCMCPREDEPSQVMLLLNAADAERLTVGCRVYELGGAELKSHTQHPEEFEEMGIAVLNAAFDFGPHSILVKDGLDIASYLWRAKTGD